MKLAAKEVNHVDEVVGISIASGPSFSKLYFVIDTFENGVSESRLDKVHNPIPMGNHGFGKGLKGGDFSEIDFGAPSCQKGMCARLVRHIP